MKRMDVPLAECLVLVRRSTKNTKKLMQVLAATIALLYVCVPAFSQASQSQIQGTVTDQTGGVIAGANVSVIDVARGTTRALVTDAAGQYVASDVIPGTYTVRVESKGFSTVERSNVVVEVGQNIRADVVLQPGEQTQTITVAGEAPEIDTSDAQLNSTVSNNLVNSLPLNGRNVERLVQMNPGTVATSVGGGTGTFVYTNGRRAGDDVYLLDGVTTFIQSPGVGVSVINNAFRSGDSSSLVSIDAIQEFTTQTDPKAQEGWKEGTVLSVAIKSGTNAIHGTAFAFGRDASATDAPNYFTGAVTPATLEQFGASAGGPILKDKLFWFASFEGLRDELGDTALVPIPEDLGSGAVLTAATAGSSTNLVDLCKFLKPAGINPLSAQITGLNPTTCVVSPGSSTVENLFPYNPSSTSTAFAPPLVSTLPLNNGIFKGDYAAGSHNHFSGLVFEARGYQTVNNSTGQLLPQWQDILTDNVQSYVGSWTWTPNSTWVNEARGGLVFSRNITALADGNLLPSNPYPNGYSMNTGVTNPAFGGLPEIIYGFGSSYFLGAGARGPGVTGPEGNIDFVDNVSYLHGKHSFKFGAEFVDIIYDQGLDGQASTPSQGVVTFNTLEALLQGSPARESILLGDRTANVRQHWFAGFAQDDWRLTSRLTLNLGLRYEYEASPVERNNYIGAFNPNVPSVIPAVEQVGPGEPITSLWRPKGNFSPRVGVAWDVHGNGKTVVRAGASLMTDYLNLFYAVGVSPFGANFVDPALGLSVNNSNTQLNAHTSAVATALGSWSLAGPVFAVSPSGLTCAPTGTGTGPCATATDDTNLRNPRAGEWNIDVERAITNSLALDVAFVGNYGYRETYWTDLNSPALDAGWDPTTVSTCINTNKCTANAAAEIGPYSTKFPYLSNIEEFLNGVSSNYNSLQVRATDRLSHGLSFVLGYTYAHALDNAASNTVLPQNLYYENGVSDVRNRFTFSPTYEIPGIKFPGQMLQGWSISPLITLQSGLPWSTSDSSIDWLGTGEFKNSAGQGGGSGTTQPWNFTGPRSAFTTGPTPIPCYGPLPGCTSFNNTPAAIMTECMNAATAPYAPGSTQAKLALAAFTNDGCYVQGGGILTPPAYGTFGNAVGGIFRGPNFYNVDLSVAKTWKMRDRYTAQLRFEFFNLFNRADFALGPTSSNPSSGSAGSFGCSCSTLDTNSTNPNPVLGVGGPRHVQFGLKLTF